MKEDFIKFLNELMNANPTLTEELMNDNVQGYINVLLDGKEDKRPQFSENGLIIFNFMRETETGTAMPAKSIATEVGLTSRQVSGAARKLVTDGFLEKVSTNPVYYALSQKGKDFEFTNED